MKQINARMQCMLQSKAGVGRIGFVKILMVIVNRQISNFKIFNLPGQWEEQKLGFFHFLWERSSIHRMGGNQLVQSDGCFLCSRGEQE